MRNSANQFLQKVSQPALQFEIATVGSGVLRDEDDLLHTFARQLAGIVQDIPQWTADGGTFDEWDGAKGAQAVAAIPDLKIGTATLHRCTNDTVFVRADAALLGNVIDWLVRPGFAFMNDREDVHPAAGAQETVNAGDLAQKVLPITLAEAAGSDEQLTFALGASGFLQGLQGFLASGGDETAGVNDEDIRLGGILHLNDAGAVEQLGHGTRVDAVLGAAKGEEVEFFGSRFGHWTGNCT